jgi:hypothetical protein
MIPWTKLNPDIWRDIPNDWAYCDLDGDWPDDADWAPELWVGRVPAHSPSEGENFVEKVLDYELNPGNGDYEYLDRAFYEQETNNTCPDVIAHQHPELENTLWSATTNPPWPYDDDVIEEICTVNYNCVVVHCHGFWDCYETTPAGDLDDRLFQLVDIEALWNGDYYYFWYSISCHNAQLDGGNPNDRSIAEGATCAYPNRCSVAFAGNTRDGYFIASTELNCCAWDMLFPQGPFVPRYHNHVGSTEAQSKWWADRIGLNDYLDRYVRYSHNLFGDPATPIWTPDYTPGSQKPLFASHPVEPLTVKLLSCHPVPTRDNVTLRFSLNHTSEVRASIYTLDGRLVHNLEEVVAGPGQESWGVDYSDLAVGAYVVKIRAGTEHIEKRIVILR